MTKKKTAGKAVDLDTTRCASLLGKAGAAARWAGHVKKPKPAKAKRAKRDKPAKASKGARARAAGAAAVASVKPGVAPSYAVSRELQEAMQRPDVIGRALSLRDAIRTLRAPVRPVWPPPGVTMRRRRVEPDINWKPPVDPRPAVAALSSAPGDLEREARALEIQTGGTPAQQRERAMMVRGLREEAAQTRYRERLRVSAESPAPTKAPKSTRTKPASPAIRRDRNAGERVFDADQVAELERMFDFMGVSAERRARIVEACDYATARMGSATVQIDGYCADPDPGSDYGSTSCSRDVKISTPSKEANPDPYYHPDRGIFGPRVVDAAYSLSVWIYLSGANRNLGEDADFFRSLGFRDTHVRPRSGGNVCEVHLKIGRSAKERAARRSYVGGPVTWQRQVAKPRPPVPWVRPARPGT